VFHDDGQAAYVDVVWSDEAVDIWPERVSVPAPLPWAGAMRHDISRGHNIAST
jgi:hypothetical protein